MPGWAWAVVVVGALVVLGIVAWAATRARRSRMLRERFGPEYNRAVNSSDDKRGAEAELAARAERRDQLHIKPLSPEARERYREDWQQVQALFVDDPQGAAHDADRLIQNVMSDRGYPMTDFEQRAADVSVDHPRVVENYREGHRLSRGDGSTEDLRQAMRHYRALFEELVEEEPADEPLRRDRAEEEQEVRR